MYLTFFKDKERVNITNTEYNMNDLFNGVQFNVPTTQDIKTNYKTKTVITDRFPSYHNQENMNAILRDLQALAQRHSPETVCQEYNTFFIPKRSGGMREINAPKEELMETLSQMKDIFQYKLHVLYHNAAYAYTPNRSIVNALQVHQQNKSRWFLKLDIKDFFPNCSLEFVTKSLIKLYPFSCFTEEQLKSFLWVCFRNDQLPQGTPMSPMLTNLIMIPIDYALQNYAQENHLCYTRYADDIILSGFESFNWQNTARAVDTVFRRLDTPFQIKNEKTRYGSSAGRNWNLGLMLNKDNKITVGYRNKKRYKAALFTLFNDEAQGNIWSKEELYHFQGLTSYYTSVEPEYFTNLIKKYEQDFNISLKDIYKREL